MIKRLKQFCFLGTLAFASSNLQAQTPVFVMSSIGAMTGTNSMVSAMNFKSNAACLDVQTGVVVLKGERNSGEFVMSCEVTMKINTLGIKLFPNPVKSATKVKFVNAPPLTETFNLSIWNTEGGMISTRKESGYNLFQGMTMDLSGLPAGSYVLRVESSNFVDAIKFIKAN
ncbi:MAG: Secretion system C-terminal sorting domain [Bacteroidota bacterium]|jgi:hypothetical protein